MTKTNTKFGIYSNTNPTSGFTYSTTAATWATISATETIPNAVQINGDAVFKGNITWQDRDMREWFESVEARLAILKPNPKLEAEWLELAELRQRYVELERRLLEKQRVFDILKKSD